MNPADFSDTDFSSSTTMSVTFGFDWKVSTTSGWVQLRRNCIHLGDNLWLLIIRSKFQFFNLWPRTIILYYNNSHHSQLHHVFSDISKMEQSRVLSVFGKVLYQNFFCRFLVLLSIKNSTVSLCTTAFPSLLASTQCSVSRCGLNIISVTSHW